jgi:hypothetical protein
MFLFCAFANCFGLAFMCMEMICRLWVAITAHKLETNNIHFKSYPADTVLLCALKSACLLISLVDNTPNVITGKWAINVYTWSGNT